MIKEKEVKRIELAEVNVNGFQYNGSDIDLNNTEIDNDKNAME